MNDPTALDLFAGAGGLALGVDDAGFKTLRVIEVERNSCETLRQNERKGRLRRWEVQQADVHDVEYSEFEDRVDLLTAGVPCQPFSLGGKHLGNDDERNLFPEAIRAVREIQPKAVLFENVKGLLRQGFRAYYEYILLKLEMPELQRKRLEGWEDHKTRLIRARRRKSKMDLTYNVQPQLLNAADYGIPQRRERVFIVAFRSDLDADWSFPEPTHSKAALLVSQWYDGTYWKDHGIPQPTMPKRNGSFLTDIFEGRRSRWSTVRDALRELPEPKPHEEYPGILNHVGNPGARAYKGHTGSPYDEPAKTLKAGVHGVPGGENTLQLLDKSVRYFTTREAARLQSFPDDYAFSGAWTETMRQIGNAVPVELATLLASRIKNTLRAAKSLAAERTRERCEPTSPSRGDRLTPQRPHTQREGEP